MSNKQINVTKSYLPPIEEYLKMISIIWENHTLTNYGPLNKRLITEFEKYLELKNLHFVTNGTVSLQLCLDALNKSHGEIITTPFTFVATLSSIIWQRYKPVFVDIKKDDFNIDPDLIEKKINKNTVAIMAVHCFGIPCDVDKISKIAKKNKIAVIYDAAHSFGTKLNGKSVLAYGDLVSCSFHATKVFHTIEGGLCISNNTKYEKKINAIKNFGNENGEIKYVGINAKNSEFHAAMGLCVLNHFDEILNKRKKIYDLYIENLGNLLIRPKMPNNFIYNYIYFPILFENEEQLLKTVSKLNEIGIYPRRYFYPALNDISIYKKYGKTPIANDISKRIVCLPLDTYLEEVDVKIICDTIKNVVF